VLMSRPSWLADMLIPLYMQPRAANGFSTATIATVPSFPWKYYGGVRIFALASDTTGGSVHPIN